MRTLSSALFAVAGEWGATLDGGKRDWWAPLECVTHCGYWLIEYGNISQDTDFVKLENGSDEVGVVVMMEARNSK